METTELTLHDAVSDPCEMLIKEARQIQRRHRQRWAVAFALATLILVGAFAASDHHRMTPGSASNSSPSSSPNAIGNPADAAFGRPLQAEEVAVAGLKVVIVANFEGVFRTDDGGRHWKDITPPVIISQPILLSHIKRIASIDGTHIWLKLIGDSRTDFNLYSSDGGKSWTRAQTFNTLPKSSQENATSVQSGHAPGGFHILRTYYVSPNLAFAQASGPEIGIFTPTYLLRTLNGGKSWTEFVN